MVKLKRVIPERQQTIEICAFKTVPDSYKQWSQAAEKLNYQVLKKCWWCKTAFKDDDAVTIVITKCSNSSKWFCKSCTELITDAMRVNKN